MPLTAAFSFRLKDQILENTACVGVYDGERPTLTAATTGGKIFMFDPYARADEGQGDARPGARVRYLNINKKVTAVAAGALGAEGADGRDILFVGTGVGCPGVRRDEQHVVHFSSRARRDRSSWYRRSAGLAARASSDEPSEIRCFWSAGTLASGPGRVRRGAAGPSRPSQSRRWASSRMGRSPSARRAAARARAVAADGSESRRVRGQEADAVTHLVPATGTRTIFDRVRSSRKRNRYAMSSRSRRATAPLGARAVAATLAPTASRSARVSKRATCATAFDLTGDGSNEIVFGFADRTMDRGVSEPGSSCSKTRSTRRSPPSSSAGRRRDRRGKQPTRPRERVRRLLACAADGEVRGYRAKGSGDGAVAPGRSAGFAAANDAEGKGAGTASGEDRLRARVRIGRRRRPVAAPAAAALQEVEKKKKPGLKLGSLLGLKKPTAESENRDERLASESGVPNSPLRAAAAVSRETLESLNARKQALLVELASRGSPPPRSGARNAARGAAPRSPGSYPRTPRSSAR